MPKLSRNNYSPIFLQIIYRLKNLYGMFDKKFEEDSGTKEAKKEDAVCGVGNDTVDGMVANTEKDINDDLGDGASREVQALLDKDDQTEAAYEEDKEDEFLKKACCREHCIVDVSLRLTTGKCDKCK